MLKLALLVLLLGVSDLVAQFEKEPGRQPRFPELKASNLEGKQFLLPRDLEGDRNLVLVAFKREQQKEIDTWLKEMKRFEEIDPKLEYYELPTISRLNAFSRWFIDSGMRHGIPDKSARARTITLYIEKDPFEKSLQIPTEDKIYPMLVNRKGDVLWRSEGPFDESKAESLRQALLRQRSGPGSAEPR